MCRWCARTKYMQLELWCESMTLFTLAISRVLPLPSSSSSSSSEKPFWHSNHCFCPLVCASNATQRLHRCTDTHSFVFYLYPSQLAIALVCTCVDSTLTCLCCVCVCACGCLKGVCANDIRWRWFRSFFVFLFVLAFFAAWLQCLHHLLSGILDTFFLH